MRAIWKLVALASPLFLIVGCGPSDEASKIVEKKQTYSLCPKTDDARQRLYKQVTLFADEEKARVIDRSSGAKRELSDIGSSVLNNTGGDSILLTVEKPGVFRISVTNLGLKEKIALAIRVGGQPGEDMAVNRLMRDLGRFWTIQEVVGGVTNDPPC
jgi:hypothetical protein